jgi:hypothetical protein
MRKPALVNKKNSVVSGVEGDGAIVAGASA